MRQVLSVSVALGLPWTIYIAKSGRSVQLASTPTEQVGAVSVLLGPFGATSQRYGELAVASRERSGKSQGSEQAPPLLLPFSPDGSNAEGRNRLLWLNGSLSWWRRICLGFDSPNPGPCPGSRLPTWLFSGCSSPPLPPSSRRRSSRRPQPPRAGGAARSWAGPAPGPRWRPLGWPQRGSSSWRSSASSAISRAPLWQRRSGPTCGGCRMSSLGWRESALSLNPFLHQSESGICECRPP